MGIELKRRRRRGGIGKALKSIHKHHTHIPHVHLPHRHHTHVPHRHHTHIPHRHHTHVPHVHHPHRHHTHVPHRHHTHAPHRHHTHAPHRHHTHLPHVHVKVATIAKVGVSFSSASAGASICGLSLRFGVKVSAEILGKGKSIVFNIDVDIGADDISDAIRRAIKSEFSRFKSTFK